MRNVFWALVILGAVASVAGSDEEGRQAIGFIVGALVNGFFGVVMAFIDVIGELASAGEQAPLLETPDGS